MYKMLYIYVGTSIVRVFDSVLALTGWNEKRLKAAHIAYQTVTITDNSHASYYPGALPITMKITFDPITGLSVCLYIH